MEIDWKNLLSNKLHFDSSLFSINSFMGPWGEIRLEFIYIPTDSAVIILDSQRGLEIVKISQVQMITSALDKSVKRLLEDKCYEYQESMARWEGKIPQIIWS